MFKLLFNGIRCTVRDQQEERHGISKVAQTTRRCPSGERGDRTFAT